MPTATVCAEYKKPLVIATPGHSHEELASVKALCFFFQAEDGIRDYRVTGVQTCALPISSRRRHTDYRVTGVQTCALPIDRKSTRLNSSHTIIRMPSSA